MFYGETLLRHLAADDKAVDEFVSLPRISRNLSVVIDSDRRSAREPLNATKRRVRTEIEDGDATGIAWITQGYTIENYVPRDLLLNAVSAVHPRATCVWTVTGTTTR